MKLTPSLALVLGCSMCLSSVLSVAKLPLLPLLWKAGGEITLTTPLTPLNQHVGNTVTLDVLSMWMGLELKVAGFTGEERRF